ncbi:hypothetical protein ASG29_03865 [Sphingomonas sp. Leaf412]|nr:hypothetical protein ASG29_03865 [Sphingomonas sp. Leaf412]
MTALIALPMWPPAAGKLLLVPITGGNANDMARIAVAGGAALVGAGPLPGSLVIAGDRAMVMRATPPFAAVAIAAPAVACGSQNRVERT